MFFFFVRVACQFAPFWVDEDARKGRVGVVLGIGIFGVAGLVVVFAAIVRMPIREALGTSREVGLRAQLDDAIVQSVLELDAAQDALGIGTQNPTLRAACDAVALRRIAQERRGKVAHAREDVA